MGSTFYSLHLPSVDPRHHQQLPCGGGATEPCVPPADTALPDPALQRDKGTGKQDSVKPSSPRCSPSRRIEVSSVGVEPSATSHHKERNREVSILRIETLSDQTIKATQGINLLFSGMVAQIFLLKTGHMVKICSANPNDQARTYSRHRNKEHNHAWFLS